MIIALIILILLSGGLNAPNLDLSDPAVLADFKQDVSAIIQDPKRANKVVSGVYQLNVMSFKTRSTNGLVEREIREFRAVASNYNSSKSEVVSALKELEHSLVSVNRSTIDGREVIRKNTTKKEWKALLKALANKRK